MRCERRPSLSQESKPLQGDEGARGSTDSVRAQYGSGCGGKLLRAGCAHMRKPLKPRDINLDELIATAIDDPQAMGDNVFRSLHNLPQPRRTQREPGAPRFSTKLGA
jgi:hypothetical protein